MICTSVMKHMESLIFSAYYITQLKMLLVLNSVAIVAEIILGQLCYGF